MPSVQRKSHRVDVAEIKSRANIADVWAALGGDDLRGNRGKAFWRQGDGLSVALDTRRGLWYDHVDGAGGDVIALVSTVQECTFAQAVAWLADFAGVAVTNRNGPHRDAVIDSDWPADLRGAQWWSIAAVMLAEAALEALDPCDIERSVYTALLAKLRLGPASLVAEYRSCRQRDPRFTAAMAHAGEVSDARVQRKLALWIVRNCG